MSQDDALRDRIIAGFDAMPPQLRQAARYLLEHPDDIALVSMREVARQAGVQPSTITRLAKHLGFDGYEQIRALHAQAIRDRVEGFATQHRPVEPGAGGLAAQMLHGLSAQIARLAEPESLARIEAAAAQLAQARRIQVLGLRSCHVVAWHFQYALSLLGERVEHLDGPAGTLGDGLMRGGPGDVLLAISVSPYSRQTLELAHLARDKGMAVVAITDSEVSPLAGIAAALILCPVQSPTFLHTLAPALAVSEVLCGLLANRDPEATLRRLQDTDRHLRALNTHASALPPRTGPRG
ncbi:MAG: MurR/RpiR family transcriptional regulator [Paracoccus aminovorans]|nr:MurR/RpiR family transcriptional regulator [Paracoccus aminovorans]